MKHRPCGTRRTIAPHARFPLRRARARTPFSRAALTHSMTALREDCMTIDEITAEMKAGAETKPALGKTLKFDFGDDGKIFLDGNNGNAISNDDNAADCTIKVALADFIDIRSGKLNAMNAFMGGKLKVDGDMSVAMKLQSIL